MTLTLKHLFAVVAVSSTVGVPTIAGAEQSGQAELPSIAHQGILIRNPTSSAIAFAIQSASNQYTNFTLGPGESSTFDGSGSDESFTVTVGNHIYDVNAGSRLYFNFVGSDVQLFAM